MSTVQDKDDLDAEVERASEEIAQAAEADRSDEEFQRIASEETRRDAAEEGAARSRAVPQLRDRTRQFLERLQVKRPDDIDYRATSGIGVSGALVMWRHWPNRRLELAFNTVSDEVIVDHSIPGGTSERMNIDPTSEDAWEAILGAILWVAGRGELV